MSRRPAIIESAAARLQKHASPLVYRALRQAGILDNAFLTAKLLPLQREKLSDGQLFVGIPVDTTADEGPDGLPMPPRNLREGWGSDDAYLNSGRRDVETMLRLLTEAGVDEPESLPRILDFGSASVRMLRFVPHAGDVERWGVDIKAKHIEWCSRHFPLPFRFATTTTFPHLPFEDGYFDLVYCGSVFTHIGELADAWLLELRRIVRPGGFIYVTIHDEHSIAMLRERYRDRSVTTFLEELDKEQPIFDGTFSAYTIGIEPWATTYYDSTWLVERWSRFAEVVSITPGAMDYQTAVLLRKA